MYRRNFPSTSASAPNADAVIIFLVAVVNDDCFALEADLSAPLLPLLPLLLLLLPLLLLPWLLLRLAFQMHDPSRVNAYLQEPFNFFAVVVGVVFSGCFVVGVLGFGEVAVAIFGVSGVGVGG